MTIAALLCLAALQTAPAAAGSAHETQTPNTIRLQSGAQPPPATLQDMAWLSGSWTGEGLGATTEEIWSAPSAGSMMGMFRLVKDDAVVFYEFLTIVPDGASIVLKLKHFNPDLTGWEEKDRWVTFRLARTAPGEVQFEGLTFRGAGTDRLTIFLAIRDRKTGSVREERFAMTRTTPR